MCNPLHSNCRDSNYSNRCVGPIMREIAIKRAQAYARHALAMKASHPVTARELWRLAVIITARLRGINHG